LEASSGTIEVLGESLRTLRGVAVSDERAVVVVTHDNRIFSFADSITQMEDGRIRRSNGSDHAPHASPTSLVPAVSNSAH